METPNDPNCHNARLVAFVDEMGCAAFAKAVGEVSGGKLSYQAVQKWLTNKRVPAERCMAVQIVTGGALKCFQLRPDVFLAPAAEPVKEAG